MKDIEEKQFVTRVLPGTKHTIRSSLSREFSRLTASSVLDINESLFCGIVAFKVTSSNFLDSSSFLYDSSRHF